MSIRKSNFLYLCVFSTVVGVMKAGRDNPTEMESETHHNCLDGGLCLSLGCYFLDLTCGIFNFHTVFHTATILDRHSWYLNVVIPIITLSYSYLLPTNSGNTY